MMGRGGVGITYGKITVFSDNEKLETCLETLNKILKVNGYPEEADFGDEDDVEELKEEIEEETEEDVITSEEKKEPWNARRKL